MANVFKRLTRGIKLLVEHVFDPLEQTMALLTTSGVTADYYEKEEGTFRIALNFPYISPIVKEADSDRATTATSVFMLPALQDEFDNDNQAIESYELIEVSVGQDTRAEPGFLTPFRDGVTSTAAEGSVVTGSGPSFTLFISSSEISTSSTNTFKNNIYKLSIPEITLINNDERANPHVETSLNIQCRHDAAYLVEIVPEFTGRAMYSFTVSMKFKTKLRQRDRGVTVQNIPTIHDGAFSSVPVTPTVPAGDSLIIADGVSGVNTGLSQLDQFVTGKLRGGYTQSGDRSYQESLLSDSGYEVISVPLFNPMHVTRDVTAIANYMDLYNSWTTLPYSAAGAFFTLDRAIIPLHYPITIHHVLVAVNYSEARNDISILRPTSTTFTNTVGVGLLTGIRSDLYAVQQVANLTWTPAGGASPIANNRVFLANGDVSAAVPKRYSWDILSIPLVGAGGKGYVAQGHPVFAATGTSQTGARRSIGGGASATGGQEQALDIRWTISDSALPNTWGANETIIGYPGHWVYIIGKKHLV